MAKDYKTGGRKRGTPNKITAEIRDKFTKLLEDNFDSIQNDLNTLEPKDRIRLMFELAKFVIPTLKATEINTNTENQLQEIIIKRIA